MSEYAHGSVTNWMLQLKEGDEEAAQQIWFRYFDRLSKMAKKILSTSSRRASDEDDVVVGVFELLFRGLSEGRFSDLSHRGDLWQFLVAITAQKTIDEIRYQTRKKRGDGKVRGDSIFYKPDQNTPAGFEQVIQNEPTPEFIAIMNEEHSRLVNQLGDDTLKQIVQWRLEGYTNEEMAEKLGTSVRTVERKLNLIREKWAKELEC